MSPSSPRAVLVGTSAEDRSRIVEQLAAEIPDLCWEAVDQADEFDRALGAPEPLELVLAEADVGWASGLDVLRAVQRLRPGVPVVLLTEQGLGDEVIAAAIDEGLADYVVKTPHYLVRLPAVVRATRRRGELQRRTAAAESRLRDFLDRAEVGVFRATLDGRIVEANPALLRLLGLGSLGDAGTVSTQNFYVDVAQRDQLLRMLRDAGEVHAHEVELRRTDGGRVWVTLTERLATAADGTPVVDGMMGEITERKRAEQALRDSEERFRLMVEGSEQVFFYVHDQEHRFEYLSPSVQAVLGYAPEELLGQAYDLLLPPDDLQGAAEVHQRTDDALATGERTSAYKAVVRHRDGRPVVLELVESPVRRDDGEWVMQGFARDITQERHAREALHESEQRYRELFENANDIIYTHDLQGRFTSLNRAAERLTGYDRANAIGSFAMEVVAPEYHEAVQANLQRLLAGEAAYTFETEIIARWGARLPMEVNNRLILRDGRAVAVQGIARDITERKEAERALRESEAKFRALSETLAAAAFIYQGLSFRHVNDAFLALTGYSREDIPRLVITDVVHPDFAEMVRTNALARQRGEEVPSRYEIRIVRRDGEERWVDFTASLVEFEGERAALGTAFDITERKRMEEALRESQQRYRRLVESSPEVIAVESDGALVYVNPAGANLLGVATPHELVGRSLADLVDPDYRELAEAWKDSTLHGDGDESHDLRLVRSDGQRIDVEITGTPILYRGKHALQFVARDVTARRQAEEALRHNALHDPLTGLPNRALFMDRLEQSIRRAAPGQSEWFAVLFLDLDGFKVVNDSLGHLAGDELLRAVGRRLGTCMRPGDTVARLGGDEFAVVVDRVGSSDEVTALAQNIQNTLAQPFQVGTRDLFASASIGVALGRGGDDDCPETLLRDADTAMYQAKALGKARHVVFDTGMHAHAVARLHLETGLRRALERGEFRLHYQPLVCLERGQVCGFEALLRWEHPERGLIAPAGFIPIAEESGLIVGIGGWVIREACRQMREWQASGAPAGLRVNINISAHHFSHPGLFDEVESALRETGVRAGNIRLEITETALINNTVSAQATMSRLRQLGVELCLDDFGTGYSSLSQLHKLPFNCLKVDRSFVGRMTERTRDLGVVRAIVSLAANFGLEVVAEGVETVAQRDALLGLGCVCAQGYLFSHPVEPAAALDLLWGGVPNHGLVTT